MIELRGWGAEDADDLFRWRIQHDVDAWSYDDPPVNRQAHQAWGDRVGADPDREEARGFAVFLGRAGGVDLRGLGRVAVGGVAVAADVAHPSTTWVGSSPGAASCSFVLASEADGRAAPFS